MARGGLSYAGIGFRAATFAAGDGIKALVTAANRDVVVNVPVVVTNVGNVVDLGNDGDVPFGFIDVYEDDGHCTVQFRGFREDVPTVATDITPGRVCLVDGNGVVKESTSGVGVKQKMTKAVTAAVTSAGNITIKVTAAGKAELANGKNVTVAIGVGDTTTTLVATAIKNALLDDADVAAFFDVTSSTADVILEAKLADVDDDTMAIAFTDTDTTGVTMGETTDVAGVADRKIGLPIFINSDNVAHKATVFLG